VLRGQETAQLFGEVLDHVVAFRLTVHQHVETQVGLQFDNVPDLRAHGLVVRLLVDPTGTERGSCLADAARLGERPDRRGRERGQAEACLLCRTAGRVVTAPVQVFGTDSRSLGPHRLDVHHRRLRPRGKAGLVDPELAGDRVAPEPQAASQDRQFLELLPGKRHPPGDLRVEVALESHVQWNVEQGAGSRHVDAVGQPEQGAQRR
jgi:hypothetical protein